MEIFEPFIHDGFVSLKNYFYKDNATPIKILRDTGSSQSLLLTDTLPFSDDSYLGSNCSNYRASKLSSLFFNTTS